MVLVCTGLMPAVSHAQDDAFLLCANLSDREQRLNCLDTALESAVREREAAETTAAPEAPAVRVPSSPEIVSEAGAATTPVTVAAPAPPAVNEAPTAAPANDTATSEPRLLNLFGLLDRDRDDEPAGPEESMQARVAALKYYKPDVWTITLENGQVWRQLYAERFNLRVGDDIQIYRLRGKVQFRLEAQRFNGFIQVERLR